MATIVYQGAGVISRGDLFAGIKFYFLRRVPSRAYWEELVQSNGGEIVNLDTQADIVIADHVRRDCPVGSISWKYVEQSVKKGELEDIEDHRTGPVTHTAREVGSSGPTRKGKTPFTAEDDRILMKWVMQGERAGMPVKGNELFRQLEEKNSRHTYQSWRDRWLKYVQHYPRPQETDQLRSPSDGPTPAPAVKKSKSARPKIHYSSRQGASNSSQEIEPDRPSANPLVTKSAGGISFSSNEIITLLQNYEDIVNIDENKQIDAWETWAVANPNHTAQEWRNYFSNELTADVARLNKKNQSKQITRYSKPKPASKSLETLSKPIADLDNQDIEIAASQSVKEDLTLLDEDLFKEYLLQLAEEVGVKEVIFNPTIRGRHISLFRLWQIVKSDEFGGNDNVNGLRLWPQVASKLNFDGSLIVVAAEDLRACYGEILADFEIVRSDYLASLEPSPIEERLRSTLVDDNLLVAGEQLEGNDSEDEDIDDDLNAPLASPSPHYSKKRNFARRARQDSSSLAGSISKRQRIDNGKGKEREIPSTPEEVISHSQTQSKAHQPSPLKSFQAADDQEEESSSDDLFKRPFKHSELSLLHSPHKTLESETQDSPLDFQENEAEELEQGYLSLVALNSPPHHHVQGSRTKSTIVETNSLEESTTQSQTESQRVTELQDYVDHNISLGYAAEYVHAALEATTMETGDAAYVMEELMRSRTIPDNVQGVWTAIDDAALEHDEGLDFKRIVAKHGNKRIKLRRKFLEDQKEVKRLMDEGSLE